MCVIEKGRDIQTDRQTDREVMRMFDDGGHDYRVAIETFVIKGDTLKFGVRLFVL